MEQIIGSREFVGGNYRPAIMRRHPLKVAETIDRDPVID